MKLRGMDLVKPFAVNSEMLQIQGLLHVIVFLQIMQLLVMMEMTMQQSFPFLQLRMYLHKVSCHFALPFLLWLRW